MFLSPYPSFSRFYCLVLYSGLVQKMIGGLPGGSRSLRHGADFSGVRTAENQQFALRYTEGQ